MNIDWGTIISALMPAIVIILGALLTALATQVRTWLKLKVGNERFDLIKKNVEIICSIIEFAAPKMGWDGEAKHAEAVRQIAEWARKNKVNITDEDISNIIKFVVSELSAAWDVLWDKEQKKAKEEELKQELKDCIGATTTNTVLDNIPLNQDPTNP